MSNPLPITIYTAGLLGGAVTLGLLWRFTPQIRASTSSSITSGKLLLTLVSLFTSTGCYIADWSETHVLNPRWPPHAKFHNGQTMSLGLCLGLATAYYTWRVKTSREMERSDVFTAGLLGSLYWVTGLSAGLYPGALFVDPEFGEGHPQAYVFAVLGGLSWVGWWLEWRTLKGVGGKGGKGKA